MFQIGDPTERLMDGTSWRELCDVLKIAGETILRESSPSDPQSRAEGYRYLSRLTRTALESFMEHWDPLAPVLHQPVHETAKMGSDNPDNFYQNAFISGEHEYRLYGTRGTIHYLGLGTYVGSYGGSGRSGQTGYLEGSDLVVGADGSLEVILSTREPPGKNWLRMDPDSSQLIVRQTYLDRGREQAADLKLERIGGDGRAAEISPERVDRALTTAGRFVVGAAALFANWSEDFVEHTNQLPRHDPGVSMAAHGDPNIVYYHSYWRLAPDEALVIEAEPPACEYWNFQLNNHWMESLDYRHHRIHINKHDAVTEKDGSVRVIVAHRDPGRPNWVQTAGHTFGTMCWRWIRAEAHPAPRTRVVKLDALRKEGGG